MNFLKKAKPHSLIRYSKLTEKEARELVLLKAARCKWHKCSFCDYHLDSSENIEENFSINKTQLDKVTGEFKILDVANSGSFFELDSMTVKYIKYICNKVDIKTLICESHWMYKDKVKKLKDDFKNIGVNLKVRIGVETFDYLFRESYLTKGISECDPYVISKFFDRVCLLFGLPGQTAESMLIDIEIALKYFEQVHVNIMNSNTTRIKPSPSVLRQFKEKIYPIFADNKRVEILFSNTDFGIG